MKVVVWSDMDAYKKDNECYQANFTGWLLEFVCISI